MKTRFENMTNAQYHAHPAMSKSVLFKMSESPEKFKWYREHPQPKSDALVFGSAFHKILLEPNDFFDEFVVAPNVDRRTKSGKAEWNEFLANAGDKEVITTDTLNTITGMAESALSNKYVKAILNGSKNEQSFFWTDEATGIECKCRPDAMNKIGDTNIILDLKSCSNASTIAFTRDAVKYGYTLQAYMYPEGVRQCTGEDYIFVFLAVEKEPPYSVNVLQADDEFIQYGEDQFREYIGLYKQCLMTNNWWGFNGQGGMINGLGLPPYLKKTVE